MRVLRVIAPALLLIGAACADTTAPAARAGEAQQTSIAPDGLTLTSNPAEPGAGDTAVVTASMAPMGSYHYKWTTQRCSVVEGELEMRCTLPLTIGGQDLTQRKFTFDYDMDWRIRVEVRNTSTSSLLDAEEIIIFGPNSY